MIQKTNWKPEELNVFDSPGKQGYFVMEWMKRQDVKEEPQEALNALTPEDDECYFEEDILIDEGMVREHLKNFEDFI